MLERQNGAHSVWHNTPHRSQGNTRWLDIRTFLQPDVWLILKQHKQWLWSRLSAWIRVCHCWETIFSRCLGISAQSRSSELKHWQALFRADWTANRPWKLERVSARKSRECLPPQRHFRMVKLPQRHPKGVKVMSSSGASKRNRCHHYFQFLRAWAQKSQPTW